MAQVIVYLKDGTIRQFDGAELRAGQGVIDVVQETQTGYAPYNTEVRKRTVGWPTAQVDYYTTDTHPGMS